MSAGLDLTIATPARILVRETGVASVRAEDESGGFGLLPGHADLLAVLPPSVLRWRGGDGAAHFCVLRGGVLTVSGGREVSVACRDGAVGDDLDRLERQVEAMRAAQEDADRKARVEQLRLHALAVRQLMRYLAPAAAPAAQPADVDAGGSGEEA